MDNKAYWYEFHMRSCEICGRDASWKERIYAKEKPKNPNDRYIQEPSWACDDHFL